MSLFSFFLMQMASHAEHAPKAESSLSRTFMMLFVVLLVVGLGMAILFVGKGCNAVMRNTREKDQATQKKG